MIEEGMIDFTYLNLARLALYGFAIYTIIHCWVQKTGKTKAHKAGWSIMILLIPFLGIVYGLIHFQKKYKFVPVVAVLVSFLFFGLAFKPMLQENLRMDSEFKKMLEESPQ